MTVTLPEHKVGKLVRETALVDCEIDVMTPEGTHDIDKWDVLKNATLDTVEFDGDNYDHVICHYKYEVTIQEQTSRASRLQPAGYKNHSCETWVSIWWDLDPSSMPEVHIEVHEP